MTYEEKLRAELVRAAERKTLGLAPVCRPFEGCPICDARREADARAREQAS